MNNEDIILDLVEWLETQLEKPLSLDIVSSRAGYSKWHLQRMFKRVTGSPMGKYILERRLSNAAVDMRVTQARILDIALRYSFDSQQTFTRAFKKYFRQTPGAYRKRDEWDCSLLRSPWIKNHIPMLDMSIITLPQRFLFGITQSYSCQLVDVKCFDIGIRMKFFRKYFDDLDKSQNYVFGLCEINSIHACNPGEVNISYTTAIEISKLNENIKNITILQEGNYLKFDYMGPADKLQNFIINIYKYYLPHFKIVRRKGADIECYDYRELSTVAGESAIIHCNYFIPCVSLVTKV